MPEMYAAMQAESFGPAVNKISIVNFRGPSPSTERRHWSLKVRAEEACEKRMLSDLCREEVKEYLRSWLACSDFLLDTTVTCFEELIGHICIQLLRPCPVFIASQVDMTSGGRVMYLCCPLHELLGENLVFAARLIYGLWMEGNTKRVGFKDVTMGLDGLKRQVLNRTGRCSQSPVTLAMVNEVFEQRISSIMVSANDRIFQFGSGSRSCLTLSSASDKDSFVGSVVAGNKEHSSNYLRALNIPVPEQFCFDVESDFSDLLRLHKKIGYPCVLKPVNGERGEFVFPSIVREEMLVQCLESMKSSPYRRCLIQEHVAGDDYRINVINGVVDSVIRRCKPYIVGDGEKDIELLLNEFNHDARVRRSLDGVSSEVTVDDEVIRRLNGLNFTFETVLKDGEILELRGSANLSQGGFRVEIPLEEVHQDVMRIAIRISRGLSIFSCGVDYLANDITASPWCSGGKFIEVNSMPQVHTKRASSLVAGLFEQNKQSEFECISIVYDEEDAGLESKIATTLKLYRDCKIFLGINQKGSVTAQYLLLHLGCEIFYYARPEELLCDKTLEKVIVFTDINEYIVQGLPVQQPSMIDIWCPEEKLKDVKKLEWILG